MREEELRGAMARYGDAVFRLALRRLGSRADAEDIYQETFLALCRQRNAPSWDDGHLKAWLLRVAMNKCSDIIRAREARPIVSLDEVPEPYVTDGGDGNHPSYERIWLLAGQLPDPCRTAFHLFYGEGLSVGEIAEVTQTREATVRVRLLRARGHMRRMMGGADD